MFNLTDIFFGEKPVYPDPTNIAPVTVPSKQEPKEALYKVGINADGQTQLAVGYPSTIILTLNDASVAHLIKLLAVNIDDSYTVTVKENETV
jgi:hypothetical protein